jgi:transglutaminase-like putative cysteine protease
MSFANLHRASFYAMLVFATLVLSIDATDSKFAMLYPVAVAAAAVLAYVTVDRNPELAVSDVLLNLLAIGSVALALLEYALDTHLLLIALGHWLVYLQLILMFRPKTVIEDWELFLLGLVQVLVGTVISQSDSVGMMLSVWAILALWVLGLFALQREGLRARGDGRSPPLAGAAASELYPGLLNLPFWLSAFRVTLTTLALGGVIFLAMPRRTNLARARGVDTVTQHLTGFDDEVQLGQLGEILENDSVVMSIELSDDRGNWLAPQGEPLWRGVTLARYDSGRWFRQAKKPGTFPILPQSAFVNRQTNRPRAVVRQQIKLESNDSNVLFGLRPMIDASSPRRYGPDLNGIDGTITRNDTRPGTFDYEVRSFLDDDFPQPGESAPSPYPKRTMLLGLPETIQPRLREIAEGVLNKALPPGQRGDTRARARALEAYLRDSGEFSYTLKLEVVDPSLDPVIDFLDNRKEGHCEYYASALTLLLRSVGIPARLVNGFKGGDWNELTRVLNVRQKHAHSWVEAYLGEEPGPDRAPRWITLDPTPGTERDRSVAQVGGYRENFRQFTDLIRYVWVFYIVGYNADRQNYLIYGPIRKLASDASRGFAMMGREFQKGYAQLLRLLHFPSARSFISPRGFAVAFVGLLLLVGVARAAARLTRALVRWLRGQDEASVALSAGAAHYRRLAQLLSAYGLERPPAETQDEFARRATVFLTAQGSETEAVADVPRLVVDAFYRVRFGHLELPPATLTHLETRLDALEAGLQATQA